MCCQIGISSEGVPSTSHCIPSRSSFDFSRSLFSSPFKMSLHPFFPSVFSSFTHALVLRSRPLNGGVVLSSLFPFRRNWTKMNWTMRHKKIGDSWPKLSIDYHFMSSQVSFRGQSSSLVSVTPRNMHTKLKHTHSSSELVAEHGNWSYRQCFVQMCENNVRCTNVSHSCFIFRTIRLV